MIEKVAAFAQTIGLTSQELEFSPIKGPEGNIEYLLHLLKDPQQEARTLESALIGQVVSLAHATLD